MNLRLPFLAAALLVGLSPAGIAAPFSMIVSSDTQYPWTNCTDGECEESQEVREARAYQLNVDQRDAMTALAAETGDTKGIIINGDLTAYGHPKELKKYKEIWLKSPLRLYEGLGNHDYLNNINDTWLNQAANGMVDYMVGRIKKDLHLEADVEVKNGFMSKDTSGSLAYSWDEGDVHFVQLHNFPTYERAWSTFVWTGLTTKSYTIQNSLDWLEADLAAASARGQAIILNFHDTDEHWLKPDGGYDGASDASRQALSARFSTLIATYPVSAIFAGHYHTIQGRVPLWEGMPDYHGIPVFYSGATSQSTFLLARFDETEFTVDGYDSTDGIPGVRDHCGTFPLYRTSTGN